MKEGYKKTAIGEIPEEWKIFKLKEFSKVVTGGTPSSKNMNYFGGEFIWVTPSDITGNKNIRTTERNLSEVGFQKARQLPSNSLLVTCIASIGKNCILRKNGSCNQQINAILPSANHDPDYLYYYLENNVQQLKSLTGTTAVPIINKSNFEQLKVALPPLPEQQKIAEILSTVDEKIEVICEQISQTQELKRGFMQSLLTKGIGHTQFKDSPLGRIPKSWDVVLLDQLSKRGSGHTPNKNFPGYYNGGIKWISLADSSKLDNRWVYKTKIKISEQGLKNSSATLHPKGTVLMSRDAGVGKSAVMPEPMAVSQHFITWNCSEKLDNWFLYYLLQFNKPYFERIAVGSTIKTIGLPFFKKFSIPLPPVDEQLKISKLLYTVDDKIEVLQEKKQQYRELKKGLMQQLLTGKKRVKIQEPEVA